MEGGETKKLSNWVRNWKLFRKQVKTKSVSRESGEEKPGVPTLQGAFQLVLCLRLATT